MNLIQFTLAFLCLLELSSGDESPTTGLPQIVEAKEITDNFDGMAKLKDHSSSRQFRIAVAKKEILRKLGMTKRPPRMDILKANIPKPVFDGEISSLFSHREEPTKSTQVVISAEEGNLAGCSSEEYCFNFHLTSKIFHNQIIDFATLQFFKESTNSQAHKVKLENDRSRGKVIAISRVPVSSDWISMRVEDQIRGWIEGGKKLSKIYSFKISCEDCSRRSDFKVANRPRYRPFLLIKTSEKKQKHIRKRRSFSVDCIPGYDKCCRQSLYVSFKEIGWDDWIIEPSGFEVNVCQGRCTGASIFFAKGHGFVKKELMRARKSAFLSVCCVPTKFDLLTLLHFDEDGFIFKTSLENMVVQECGCM